MWHEDLALEIDNEFSLRGVDYEDAPRGYWDPRKYVRPEFMKLNARGSLVWDVDAANRRKAQRATTVQKRQIARKPSLLAWRRARGRLSLAVFACDKAKIREELPKFRKALELQLRACATTRQQRILLSKQYTLQKALKKVA